MNRDRIEGSWKEFKGHLRERWALFTGDCVGALAGRRGQIAGRMQKTYGRATERSQKQLSEWRKRMGQTRRARETGPAPLLPRHLNLIYPPGNHHE